MRQETFAILFLMRKGRPKKNGLAPIFARITTGGLRQEVYTQCDSNPETWNQYKERAMGTNKLAIQVNERLNDFRVKIIDIRSKLLAEGYAANAAQIKQRYLNPTCNTMMLIAGLTDYVKRRQAEVGVRITQRTADKYERLLRYLKQYLAQRGKAEDIPVERMNYEFLDGFNLFLQTAHRQSHADPKDLDRLPRPFGPQALAGEGDSSLIEGVLGGVDKVLQPGGGGVPCDDGGAERVYGRLDHHVGDGEDDALDAGGEADLQHERGFVGVEADLPQVQTAYGIDRAQPDDHQNGGEQLRDGGGDSHTCHTQMKDNNE